MMTEHTYMHRRPETIPQVQKGARKHADPSPPPEPPNPDRDADPTAQPSLLRRLSAQELLSKEASPSSVAPQTASDAPEGPPEVRAPPRTRSLRRLLSQPGLPPQRLTGVHVTILVATCALALYLRLRDPLSSAIIGAEDPYLHMERTWDLLQGHSVSDYPIGFMVFLLPFALMGPDAFYLATRFLPPLLGVGSVLAMFFLCRRYMQPMGALSAALVLAVMPEHILRTELMFPTALDLLLLPILFLSLIRGLEGRRNSLIIAGAIGLVLLFTHPWVVALAVPPLAAFWIILLVRDRVARRWAAPAAGASFALFAGVVWFLPLNGFPHMLASRAVPRLEHLASTPSSLFPLPPFVNLDWQFTLPVLLLAGVGAILAFFRRNRLTLLALLWTLFLLPLALVDWFGITFLPHRIVAYLGLGIAILAALPIVELVSLFAAARPKSSVPAAFGILGVFLLLTVPSAMAMPPWYRLYDEEDYEAWHALDDRGTDYLMAGSWQSRAGYRALTGGDAIYYPAFFQDERVRSLTVESHPELVVLIDQYTKQEGLPTAFLQNWTLVGQWGDSRAYTPA